MKRQNNKAAGAIRSMIHHRLKAVTEIEGINAHPDEDTICAFMEGRLEENAASQVVSHLIACSSCRHATAELSRFEVEVDAVADLDAPSGVQLVPDGLISQVIPSFKDDAVFAYQEPEHDDSESKNNEPERGLSDSSDEEKKRG